MILSGRSQITRRSAVWRFTIHIKKRELTKRSREFPISIYTAATKEGGVC